MPSIFSRIISGEIPSYKIAENEQFFAFLDVNPLVKGHVLVVPKQEVDYFFDMDDHSISEIMVFAKRVAKAIKAAIPCRKVGMTVIGLEVPHAHIHLIPMNQESDIHFGKQKLTLAAGEMEEIAEVIRKHFKE